MRPDFPPINLLFFQCLLQQVGVAPSWPYLALVEYRTKWIRIKWGPGVYGIWGSNSTTQQILLCSSLLLVAVLGSFSFRRKILLFPWKWLLLRRKVWRDPSAVQSVSTGKPLFLSFPLAVYREEWTCHRNFGRQRQVRLVLWTLFIEYF